MSIIDAIQNFISEDAQLARSLDEVREYAHVYVLARQRQKGCDGMGELVTLKEEFKDMIERFIKYCLDRKYITEAGPYDIDSLADEIERASR
jgi:hypothetical protein